MSKFDFNSVKEILRCPKCHSTLILNEVKLVCTSKECRLSYSIEDDIPVMLIDSATELSDQDWEKIFENSPE